MDGLFLELDCRQGAVPVFSGHWTAVGVGTPLTVHSDFERVGATCPAGSALTGIRFDVCVPMGGSKKRLLTLLQTGGCGLNRTTWEEANMDYTKCSEEDDSTQGLVMEIQCASYCEPFPVKTCMNSR